MDPGVNLKKLFWSKCTHSSCKLDLFRAFRKLVYNYKIVQLTKSVIKTTPKMFYEIDSWSHLFAGNKEECYNRITFHPFGEMIYP
jgi:hypothetical protein